MRNFPKYFSEQARQPSGLFGRIIMPVIFDRGNLFLNRFVYDLMDIKPDEQIFENGCGTGQLIKLMASKLETGFIEGIDFSPEMVIIAKRKNRKHIHRGTVKIVEDDIEKHAFIHRSFTRVISVNTIYFWEKPKHIVEQVTNLLQPGGRFVLAFEDIRQLERRKLSRDVFRLYSEKDVYRILENGGFSKGICIESREKRKLRFHCAVATK